MRLSLLLISLFSLQVFGFEKVRLKSVSSNGFYTVVMDTTCFSTPRTFPFEFVKHKISIHQRIQAFQVRLDNNNSLEKIREQVANDSCILSLSSDGMIHIASDPMRPQQLYLDTAAHEAGAQVFFESSMAIQKNVVVGIVDTGINATHPDLFSQMWRGAGGAFGYDFINDDSDPSDDNAHGSHVAGLAGARRNNNIGIEGIMGRNIQLMALKSQDEEGNGLLADVVNAVRWGTDHGAEVLNLSLASKLDNPDLKDAIQYAINQGVVVVVAAGNEGEKISATNIFTPALYAPALPGLLSVGAINQTDLSLSGFSNYSSDYVEVGAVGQEGLQGILSTVLTNKYGRGEGTSMASPQVAGAAALAMGFLKTHRVNYTPAEIETIIQLTCDQRSGLSTAFTNGQILNIDRLANYLLNMAVVTTAGGFDEAP